MKINIYYGGRGVIEDPTIYVLDQMEEALAQLKIEVKRYNIYEYKNSVSTLVNTLSNVDGVILATTVEWLGIGGYMTQFLDSLWFYANKDELSQIYMMPVVISTTYGERESLLVLENAWEILGGLPCSGLCGYVENFTEFENNEDYRHEINKKAENMYRTIYQKIKGLPNSNKAVSKTVLKTQSLVLTPQESEQLSHYAADDNYVEKQKKDIMDLSSIYRSRLGNAGDIVDKEYINDFISHFKPVADFSAKYLFEIDGKPKPLSIKVNGVDLECVYNREEEYDVLARLPEVIMDEIVNGRKSFTGAFSLGEMTAKGHLSTLKKLDELFVF